MLSNTVQIIMVLTVFINSITVAYSILRTNTCRLDMDRYRNQLDIEMYSHQELMEKKSEENNG